MNAPDLAAVFRAAAATAVENDCHRSAEALGVVAADVAEDPVLAAEMWSAMRDTLFMIGYSERRAS